MFLCVREKGGERGNRERERGGRGRGRKKEREREKWSGREEDIEVER